MQFQETQLAGVWLVRPERQEDARGHFARLWCHDEFESHGLVTTWAQSSTSFNRQAGCLRGLHYQAPPHAETKLIRCTRGAVYDVALDLRPDSPSFGRWQAFELGADNPLQLYLPSGCAHGFQTLLDNTELHYEISVPYHPSSALGVRWDDPRFDIHWPETNHRVISDRDRQFPDFKC